MFISYNMRKWTFCRIPSWCTYTKYVKFLAGVHMHINLVNPIKCSYAHALGIYHKLYTSIRKLFNDYV